MFLTCSGMFMVLPPMLSTGVTKSIISSSSSSLVGVAPLMLTLYLWLVETTGASHLMVIDVGAALSKRRFRTFSGSVMMLSEAGSLSVLFPSSAWQSAMKSMS